MTLIVPDTVEPPAGDVIDTEGGVVSGGGPLLTETGLELYWRPSRSLATAIRVCDTLPAAAMFHDTE